MKPNPKSKISVLLDPATAEDLDRQSRNSGRSRSSEAATLIQSGLLKSKGRVRAYGKAAQ